MNFDRHTHIFIPNMTLTQDGKILTIDIKYLMKQQKLFQPWHRRAFFATLCWNNSRTREQKSMEKKMRLPFKLSLSKLEKPKIINWIWIKSFPSLPIIFKHLALRRLTRTVKNWYRRLFVMTTLARWIRRQNSATSKSRTPTLGSRRIKQSFEGVGYSCAFFFGRSTNND